MKELCLFQQYSFSVLNTSIYVHCGVETHWIQITQGGCKSLSYIVKIINCGMKRWELEENGFYFSKAERCKSLCPAE